MRTINEMRQLVADKKTNLLTIDKANGLIGKEISTIYFGYRGQDGVDQFVVGEIISEYELAKRQPVDGYANRADYWEDNLAPEKIEAYKRELAILTSDGRDTFIRCYSDEGIFWCSDSDRFVQYIEYEN